MQTEVGESNKQLTIYRLQGQIDSLLVENGKLKKRIKINKINIKTKANKIVDDKKLDRWIMLNRLLEFMNISPKERAYFSIESKKILGID